MSENQEQTGAGKAFVAHGNLMDSPTSNLDDLLKERLEDAFHYETSIVQLSHVAKIAAEHEPIDLAYAVARLPAEARPIVFENLPNLQAKVNFFINTDANTRSVVYRHLSDAEIRELVEEMPSDEAVWVLENLPTRRLRRLLDSMDQAHAETIRKMQQCDRNSAGWLMNNEFFAFTSDMTIGEVADFIREHPGIGLTRAVFVVSHTGELQGYVPGRNLIVNKREMRLQQVMKPIAHQVAPCASRDEVVDLFERYKMPALPVVEEGDVLVGVVTYETVIETLEDMADETIAAMAGTLERVDSNDPIFKRIFSRAPWLMVTLVGGLINAVSISYFEGVISPWLAFAVFFVPLITGMSGNVGIVCSTVLVRGMATGAISSGTRRAAIGRELKIGVVTGVIFGLLCGIVVYTLNAIGMQHMGATPLAVALVVSAGLFGACITATLLGVFSPLLFARLGVDPAISSGPIVTAFNDVLSMVMYFVIAQTIDLTLFSQF